MRPSYAHIASQWVRVLRGRRSQAHVSRRLGYRSNVLYTWEAGTAFPPAHRAFAMAELIGREPAGGLGQFFREVPSTLVGVSLGQPQGVTALMVELRGTTPIAELAKTLGVSRFTVSRWLNGHSQPVLNELFAYVEAASLRLLDFLALWVDPAELPEVAEAWSQLVRARRLGYEHPSSHGVLRALETRAYAKRPSINTLCRLLGMEAHDVTEHLRALQQSGQVVRRGKRLLPSLVQNVDFRADPIAAQRVKAFWANFAADRTKQPRPGLFAYNLFAVSSGDLHRLQALQRAYLREMHTIIAKSEPCDVVALFNCQMFALDD